MNIDVEASFQRGFEFRCAGEYPAAKAEFQKILAEQPGHVRSLHQMGLIQGFEGDFDGSLAALQKLSDENPTDVDLRYDLAMTQMMLAMNDEACANFRAILAADPNHEKARQQVVYC